jgi:4-methylaminobutanoate oxidase (formaldehyde-forming)
VVLMDMSFMAKFRVEGRDAGRLLNHLSCNEIDGPAGRVTYTQWLNDRGTVEADLTVTKRSDEAFLVVASDTAHRHVETLLRRQLTDEMRCHVVDVTSGVAQINVQGPKSRALLQSLTDSALSNDDFPFRTAREIDIGFAKVLCLRITYVGELGYELYLPAEQAAHVYERLLEAGRAFDVRHAGLKALSSLRLEKGYRDYGHDIDNTDTVLEVGLGFAVDLTKAGGFRGRERVVSQKAQWPLRRGLVSVLLKDPEVFLFHGEVVHRNGRAIGTIRSASYGHTVGGAVGLAMIEASEPITASFIETGVWSVDVAGLQVPARVSLRAFYDPENRRVRNS